jgi:hypothetical protein
MGAARDQRQLEIFVDRWCFRSALEPRSGEFANVEAHCARAMARPAVMKIIEIEEMIGYSRPR